MCKNIHVHLQVYIAVVNLNEVSFIKYLNSWQRGSQVLHREFFYIKLKKDVFSSIAF